MVPYPIDEMARALIFERREEVRRLYGYPRPQPRPRPSLRSLVSRGLLWLRQRLAPSASGAATGRGAA